MCSILRFFWLHFMPYFTFIGDNENQGASTSCLRATSLSSNGSAASLGSLKRGEHQQNGRGVYRLPCRNFINFSQDGTVEQEGGGLILNVNIEQSMAMLTKCSFDESHRQPISLLGGIRALAEVLQVIKKSSLPTC